MDKKTRKNLIYRRTFRKWIILPLLFGLLAMTCSACGGKETAEAPELRAPVALTDSYRPVEMKDIGSVHFLKGIVVPEAYPVFSEKPFYIRKLAVNPGDHVEKGALIAEGDTRELDASIRNMNRQLEVLRLQRTTGETISKLKEQKLVYLKKAAEEVGYTEEAAYYAKQISIEAENRRYDLASVDTAMAEINQEIAKVRKEKDKLVFTAPHSGQVTYLVDISSTNEVAANTNIAVISDMDDLYIEANVSTKEYEYKNYESKYIMSDGVKIPVKEYEYTSAELSYADNLGNYPPVRFRQESGTPEIGSTVPIYFTKTSGERVLAIGNDSIYQEGDTYYCYVLGEDGQRERRDVIIGARDPQYAEVKSGLAEGELVFYDNKSVMPTKYKEYEVKTGDYVEEKKSEYISLLLTNHDIYVSDVQGSVQEKTVNNGDTVEQGQAALTIAAPPERGEKADLTNRIREADQGHADQVKEFDATEKELKAQLEQAGKAPKPEMRKPEKQQPKKEEKKDTTEKAEKTEKTKDKADEEASDPDEQEEVKEEKTDPEEEKEETAEPEEDDQEEETGPSKEETDALRDSKYLKERLTLDLQILAQQRNLEAAQYAETKSRLSEESAQLSGSSSDGRKVIRVDKGGKLGDDIPELNTTVSQGQYLFTVSREGKKILRINMAVKRGESLALGAQPGQKITFKADGKTYTGTCVAKNGDPGHVYLFTRDDKERITVSTPYSSGKEEQFFVEMDDDSYFAGEELPTATASFQGVSIHGGITVPAKAVYVEKDSLTQGTSTFVWKVTKYGLSKQEVSVYEVGQYSEERLILSGLSAGDVIAVE